MLPIDFFYVIKSWAPAWKTNASMQTAQLWFDIKPTCSSWSSWQGTPPLWEAGGSTAKAQNKRLWCRQWCLIVSRVLFSRLTLQERRTDLIAVTKHGRENVLQEGEDVLVGLEQTPHGLQLHHLWVGPLRDWEVKQVVSRFTTQAHSTSGKVARTAAAYCCGFLPRWKGRSGSCRCSRPSSRSHRSSSALRGASPSGSRTAPGTGSYRWTPLRGQKSHVIDNHPLLPSGVHTGCPVGCNKRGYIWKCTDF